MQKRMLVLAAVGVCLMPLPFLSKSTFAQAVAGTLLGTVQDSSGAVIPGRNGKLPNEGTNVTNQTTTGPQGFYTFPNLNPGQYSVVVEAKGFKKIVSAHNQVQVEKTTRVDLTLMPGAATAEVTVMGATPLV